MNKSLHSISFVTFVVLLIVCLVGCGGLTKAQRSGIPDFGKATATLGNASKEQFQGGRETVIKMKKQQLAIEKIVLPEKRPDGTAVDRKYFEEKVLNLDSGLDPANIETRVNAVELLIKYGNLLVAFSENTQEKELTAAATEFTDSIKEFPNNTLTADEVKGLGQLVIMAGKLWVENEKKEALKKIIPTVSPLITQVCDILEKDFDLKKNGVLADIFNTQDRLANAAIDGLKTGGGSINDRLLLIDGFAFANENKLAVETSSPKLLKAVDSLRKADKNLTVLINDDNSISSADIKSFADDAKDLANAIKPFLK